MKIKPYQFPRPIIIEENDVAAIQECEYAEREALLALYIYCCIHFPTKPENWEKDIKFFAQELE